ncbi:MAG TPA: CerR family C-terminal domain-containing protein [Candidatus Acidoferrales bacterium]|jgi:TetR/AcrR family transcriptional regulator|nr:CerR family C-terminal domain-containing protein [Candidatus Acidoferrales bacterium]
MRAGRRKVENPLTARRILAAAEQHFAAQGMAGARTEEIAAAAHANKAMLYYYFGDKRRLHRAVMENLLRQLRNVTFGALGAKSSSRDRLIAWVNGYFDFLATHPNFPRLVQREVMETSKIEWIVREYFRPFHKRLAGLIEDGIASGEFRKVDAHQTVFTLIGMTVFYFASAPVMSRVTGHNILSPQALKMRRRALLDFVGHGLIRKHARSR